MDSYKIGENLPPWTKRIDHVGNITVRSESLELLQQTGKENGYFGFVLYYQVGTDLEMILDELKQRLPELKE